MYERSAIVLEKYFNKILGFDKKANLKNVYKDYKDIIEEIEGYQKILKEEDEIINEFDDTANDIRNIQQEQKKIYKANLRFEEDRNKLFDSFDEDPSTVERRLKKIEECIEENNSRLKELRELFTNSLTKFVEKQKQRNKYSRNRRSEEKIHLDMIEKSNKNIEEIDVSILKDIKTFINSDDNMLKREVTEIMMNNGKDERVPFDESVIENAVNIKIKIAKKEAECYILIYDRMRKLLLDANNDDIKLDKYKKVLRDVIVKLEFLKAQKMYIVSFLDNERMTTINGLKVHKQLMEDACKNFELDMAQFNNLYELILKEISGKASKKAYKELYNKEYLKNIEDKEKSFEKEVNNIKIKAGTIINSNYWRIEEIKNIYQVFQNEVSEKFEKDLSEFKLEETEESINFEVAEEVIYNKEKIIDDIFKSEIDNNVEYIEEYEYEDEEYDENDNYEESEDIKEDISEEYDEEEYYEEDDDNYDSEEEYEDGQDDKYEEYEEYEYEEDDETEYEEDSSIYEDDEYEEDDSDNDDEYIEYYEEDEEEYEENDDEYEYYEEDDDFDEQEEEENDYDEKDENNIIINKLEDNNQAEHKKNSKGKRYIEGKRYAQSKKGIFNKLFKDKKD